MRGLAPALALTVLATLVVPLQRRVDASRASLVDHHDLLYARSPRMLRSLFVGFEDLAADFYWLRTVQYFGSERLRGDSDFEFLLPLVDITTTLDPRLEVAYRYGAIFLCESSPAGAGRPEEGIKVLEMGVAAMPLNWRLKQDLGFFTFLFLGDSEKAARILDEAAAIPGAAFWLKYLAADILATGDSRDVARRMWQQMYEQSNVPAIRNNAVMRLQILDAQDQAEGVAALVDTFARSRGHLPERLEDLRTVGLAKGREVDPSGTPWEYDSTTGTVRVSTQSPLWRPHSAGATPGSPASRSRAKAR